VSTLDESPVRDVLNRLYAQAKATDAVVMRKVRKGVAADGGVRDDRKYAPLLDQAYLAIAPEVGRLIYSLARVKRPAIAVEFGTSFGISAIHIASALKDNGEDRLITTELSESKSARAAQNLAKAGIASLVEIRQGDAFHSLVGVANIDLLLLDGWKQLYLPLLKMLEPALSEGCLVLADDLYHRGEARADLKPYVRYVRDPTNGYVSTEIPIDDGLELSVR
jgi:predicted O-methyltransferase YrrM